MFERFTDPARRVLTLAQEEAPIRNHHFIGTEDILLGLIREGDGVAARALEALDIHLDGVRREVDRTLGPSDRTSSGSRPFSPNAKRALELSLREALALGHNHVGTEHLLLGLIREGGSAAVGVLGILGADVTALRREVIASVAGQPPRGAPETVGAGSGPGLSGPAPTVADSPPRSHRTPMRRT